MYGETYTDVTYGFTVRIIGLWNFEKCSDISIFIFGQFGYDTIHSRMIGVGLGGKVC